MIMSIIGPRETHDYREFNRKVECGSNLIEKISKPPKKVRCSTCETCLHKFRPRGLSVVRYELDHAEGVGT